MFEGIREINIRQKQVMYIKIDTLEYHAASPFFNSEKGESPAVSRSKESPDDFSGKLTELLRLRNRLPKPASKLLQMLIEIAMDDSLDLSRPLQINAYEVLAKLGYKNIASFYSALGPLCESKILAIGDHRARKGHVSLYLNPDIFGRKQVIVGSILEVAS